VTVRPIVTLDGRDEINEVFFDDVRVPVANRVGEEDRGWTYAKYLLGYERTNIAGIARSKQQLRRLKAIAAAEMSNGRPLLDERRFREKIAAVEIELMALEMTNLRVLADGRPRGELGHAPSLLKIKGTEIQQSITELLLEAVGPFALPFVPEALEEGSNVAPVGPAHAAPVAPHYFNWRKVSIFGGSNEIQRNVVAKMVLGF
jgi:alkylation response protein AidB-like acyl-CoA dehydrogenase